MAQAISVIQQTIIATLVAALATVGMTIDPTEWSDYDYRQLLTFAVATAIGSLQQLWDAYTALMDATIATVAPQTPLWLQNLVLNIFQYSAITPQIIQFDKTNIVPYYTTTNAALRIVTQCAVVPGSNGTTTIRVAKQSPGIQLLPAELDALNSTLATITVPGIIINATSNPPDQIYINGIVTYNGTYSGIIPVANGTVVQAIQAYLASIPTTGIVSVNSPVGLMRVTDLIIAVRAVAGVIDFELINVNARAVGTPFVPGANNLVSNADQLQTQWNSGFNGAGYMQTETTTGYDINSSLTYNAV